MAGLDKILKHIEENASAIVSDISAKTKTEADEMMAEAKAKAQQKCADIKAKSEQEVVACLSRAESAAALQGRKAILNAKQEMINSIIEKARKELANMPKDQYFKTILQMVKKYAKPEAGTIMFSKEDSKNLPQQFADLLKEALATIPSATLTISQETRKIDGGFILIYGEIEENCSFDALFSAEKDSMQDKVCELLFS